MDGAQGEEKVDSADKGVLDRVICMIKHPLRSPSGLPFHVR